MTFKSCLVNVISTKKCREKTHSKKDGKLQWVYVSDIGDGVQWYSVMPVPLGELNVSLLKLNGTEGLLSRPIKPIKYA